MNDIIKLYSTLIDQSRDQLINNKHCQRERYFITHRNRHRTSRQHSHISTHLKLIPHCTEHLPIDLATNIQSLIPTTSHLSKYTPSPLTVHMFTPKIRDQLEFWPIKSYTSFAKCGSTFDEWNQQSRLTAKQKLS